MSDRLHPWLLLSPALAIIILLFIGGIALGLTQSFGYLPLIDQYDFNFDAYVNIFQSREFTRSLTLTTYIAFTSTIISGGSR